MEVVTWALGVAFTASLAFTAWIGNTLFVIRQDLDKVTSEQGERRIQFNRLESKLDRYVDNVSELRVVLASHGIASTKIESHDR